MSSGSGLPFIENSRCQSVGDVLSAVAYDDPRAPPSAPREGPASVLASAAWTGVSTREPFGVWATTLEPSEQTSAGDGRGVNRSVRASPVLLLPLGQNAPSVTVTSTVFSAGRGRSSISPSNICKRARCQQVAQGEEV
jgi:hypothetical protein